MSRDIVVYLDQNNKTSTAAGYYMNRLQSALREFIDDVELVADPAKADVIHHNDLNVWAAMISGKESRLEHVRLLTESTLRHRDAPLVITDHGNIHATDAKAVAYGSSLDAGGALSAFVRTTKKVFARAVDQIIAVSNDHKESLVGMGLSAEKIHPIYHGIDNKYGNIAETDTDDPFVLHVSNYGGKKNPDAVYEVAQRLDVRFVIAGGGWRRRAPNDVLADDAVEILGYVPEEKLIELYNRASAFYLPTLYESFGLPLVEAMACGTAVVTTDVHAVPEVTGNAAVHCPPNDVDGHIAALEDILDDDQRRRELEQASVERASAFSWERTARETVAAYEEALAS